VTTHASIRVSGLADYSIDPQHGFLPARDPLDSLDDRFAIWESVALNLSALVMTGRLREAVEHMPELPVDGLTSEPELERAFLLLSCLGNAYVWGDQNPATTIPRGLAVPWCALAARLDRPPVIAHASIVLNNWRRLTTEEPLSTTNIDTQLTFLGGVDEKWFYLATVGVELTGAPVLPLLVDAQHAVVAGNADRLTAGLLAIAEVITAMTSAFLDVERWCDPHVFYHRVRPYLAGWDEPGIVYEGVDDQPRVFSGGSAAQSSLIQAVDAGLDIPHEHEWTRSFLRGMRDYMPVPHRRFLEDLEAGPSVHAYVANQRGPQLTAAYNSCVRALAELRAQHIGLTGRYIRRFDRGTAERGTGGTNFTAMLTTSRAETTSRELS
jgi:indoleamine 2,3-dioxygenase